MLCKKLDYAECPFPQGACADKCIVEDTCPVTLSTCQCECPDTRCTAIEEG